MKERRTAARIAITPPLDGRLGGVPVRIVELSMVGARVEHRERFGLANPELEVVCQGTPVKLQVQIVRSQIAGRGEGGLTYTTGIEFTGDQLLAQHVLSVLLTELGPPPAEAPSVEMPVPSEMKAPAITAPEIPETSGGPKSETAAAPPPPAVSLDDSWTRRVKFLRDDSEDDLPYAQFHLIGDRWTKEYSTSAEQPEDGFTVRRDSEESAELQHAYMYADDDTRRMMRIALQTKLAAATDKSGR